MKKNIILFLSLLFFGVTLLAHGAFPEYFLYQGELLDSNNQPRAGTYEFRFSFWTARDFQSNDILSNGQLDTSKSTYLQWQESQSVELMEEGRFSVKIGETSLLFRFALMLFFLYHRHS